MVRPPVYAREIFKIQIFLFKFETYPKGEPHDPRVTVTLQKFQKKKLHSTGAGARASLTTEAKGPLHTASPPKKVNQPSHSWIM